MANLTRTLLSLASGGVTGFVEGTRNKETERLRREGLALQNRELDQRKAQFDKNFLIQSSKALMDVMTKQGVQFDNTSTKLFIKNLAKDLNITLPGEIEQTPQAAPFTFSELVGQEQITPESRESLAKERLGVDVDVRDKPTSSTTKRTGVFFKFFNAGEKIRGGADIASKQIDRIDAAIDRMKTQQTDPNKKVNLIAIGQVVVTAFNKTTDETSVVRESEYNRTPEGASLINRIQGKIAKVTRGGPGLLPSDLIEIQELTRELVGKAIEHSNKRFAVLRAEAARAGITPDDVLPLIQLKKSISGTIAETQQAPRQESAINNNDIKSKLRKLGHIK